MRDILRCENKTSSKSRMYCRKNLQSTPDCVKVKIPWDNVIQNFAACSCCIAGHSSLGRHSSIWVCPNSHWPEKRSGHKHQYPLIWHLHIFIIQIFHIGSLYVKIHSCLLNFRIGIPCTRMNISGGPWHLKYRKLGYFIWDILHNKRLLDLEYIIIIHHKNEKQNTHLYLLHFLCGCI